MCSYRPGAEHAIAVVADGQRLERSTLSMSAETHPSRIARRVARWPVRWLRSRSRSRQVEARLAKARRQRIALVATLMTDGLQSVAPHSPVRAAVAAGDRILIGLAHEWAQISLVPAKG